MNILPPFLPATAPWIDRMMAALSPAQRIGQLLHVAAWSDRDDSHEARLLEWVQLYGIGGIIFFQGDPVRQAGMSNRLQAASAVPLMISMDAEWGLGMRLPEQCMSFPYALTLGAIQDNKLIYRLGAEIARQCRRMGVQVNFAPVADLNTRPENPVIGFRAFGSDREAVSEKAWAYAKGMQDQRVLAVVKHFPGHGDTHSDSHLTLPVLDKSLEELESKELYPFRQLIGRGAGGVMAAHLHIPALDARPNLAGSLSQPVVTTLLRERLGFDGLVFTDALNMKGVSQFYPPGKLDLLALMAGNDVLLYPEDVPAAISAIEAAIAAGDISPAEIDLRLRRQLAAKYWCGLAEWQPVAPEGLIEDLHSPAAEGLQEELAAAALTCLRNEGAFLPLTQSPALLSLQCGDETPLQQLFPESPQLSLPAGAPQERLQVWLNALPEGLPLVLAVHAQGMKATEGFGIAADTPALLQIALAARPAALLWFANPYGLPGPELLAPARALLMAYQDSPALQRAAAAALRGELSPKGRLPIELSTEFPLHHGLGI